MEWTTLDGQTIRMPASGKTNPWCLPTKGRGSRWLTGRESTLVIWNRSCLESTTLHLEPLEPWIWTQLAWTFIVQSRMKPFSLDWVAQEQQSNRLPGLLVEGLISSSTSKTTCKWCNDAGWWIRLQVIVLRWGHTNTNTQILAGFCILAWKCVVILDYYWWGGNEFQLMIQISQIILVLL